MRCDTRDFRLGRIKSLALKLVSYTRQDHASLQQYLQRDSNRELHELVVVFTPEAHRFVGEHRYTFGCVWERETDAGVEMTFNTYLDYFARWLLQFSSGASSSHVQLQGL